MSNIIEEIKQSRIASISEEQKNSILENIKRQLVHKYEARIDGAAHYREQVWNFPKDKYCQAPFEFHAAIEQWLKSLGFRTRRYYNSFGVDQGLLVSI